MAMRPTVRILQMYSLVLCGFTKPSRDPASTFCCKRLLGLTLPDYFKMPLNIDGMSCSEFLNIKLTLFQVTTLLDGMVYTKTLTLSLCLFSCLNLSHALPVCKESGIF